jgi:DNA-binding transcriptional LysR family regulator
MNAGSGGEPSPGHLPDLRLLLYFVTLAEELHFGRAANRRHITQPALSKQLKRLEQQLGVRLFDRSRQHVELTAAGEALLEPARDALGAAAAFQAQAEHYRHRLDGRLRVGFCAQAANEFTPVILRQLACQHPDAIVELRQYPIGSGAQAVAGSLADVAFLRLPVRTTELRVLPLFDEGRVAVLPEDHPLSAAESAGIASLLDEAWILSGSEDSEYQAFAQAAGQRRDRPLRAGATVRSVDDYLEAVLAHQGIGLAPSSAARYYARPGIRYVPVPDAERSVVALAWPNRPGHPVPLAAALIQIAVDVVSRARAVDGMRVLARGVPRAAGPRKA